MEKISNTFEKAELKNLLEVIQYNLAFNIDAIYEQSLALIDSAIINGKKQEHNLGWKKEELKKQIGEYLKIVVKNIIYQMRIMNPNNIYMVQIIQRLEKAVKK